MPYSVVQKAIAWAGGDTQVRYLRYADAEKIAPKLKEQITGVVQATGGGARPAAGKPGAAAAAEKPGAAAAKPADAPKPVKKPQADTGMDEFK